MPTTSLARTRTALEVELTLKGQARIYLAYRQHLEATADQAYERVEYVFSNRGLYETYVRCFEYEWPDYFEGGDAIEVDLVDYH